MNFAISSRTMLKHSDLAQSDKDLFYSSSVTMLIDSQVSIVSMQLKMQGCSSIESTLIQFYRLLRLSSLLRDDFKQVLIATLPSSLLLAALTTEQVPLPIMGPSLKSFSFQTMSSLLWLFCPRFNLAFYSDSMLLSRLRMRLFCRCILGRPSFQWLLSLQSSISWRVSMFICECSKRWSSLLDLRTMRVSLFSNDFRYRFLYWLLVLILRMQGRRTSLPSSTSPILLVNDISVFKFSFFVLCDLLSAIKLLKLRLPAKLSIHSLKAPLSRPQIPSETYPFFQLLFNGGYRFQMTFTSQSTNLIYHFKSGIFIVI